MPFRPLHGHAAAVFLMLASSAAHGAIVADSVADFSGVQGQGNWYYGYWAGAGSGYTAANFTPMDASDWTGTIWDFAPNPNFLTITSTNWHPNGGSGTGAIQTPIRRWIAEGTGTVTITGQTRNNDTLRGSGQSAVSRNGTTARIYVEGSQIFSRKIAWSAYPGFTAYSVTAAVAAGDRVDFSVHYDGDVNDDLTYFTAAMDLVLDPEPEPEPPAEPSPVPEPSAMATLGSGLAFLWWRRLRKGN